MINNSVRRLDKIYKIMAWKTKDQRDAEKKAKEREAESEEPIEEEEPEQESEEQEPEEETKIKQKIEKLESKAKELKKAKEEPRRLMVVKELPLVPTRVVSDENGELVDLITIEEALTKIMEDK